MFSNYIGCYPLSKKITLFIGSILLSNIVTAHKCYVCGPNTSDTYINGDLMPSCIKFNYNDPKFIKTCDSDSKGCSIQTNGTLVTRACEDIPIQDCKMANNVEYCYCISDLCNKYHPTHVDDDSDEDEGSGVKNIIFINDITSTTTTTISSSEPSHVTESIPKHNSCTKIQADIIIIVLFHIGKKLFH